MDKKEIFFFLCFLLFVNFLISSQTEEPLGVLRRATPEMLLLGYSGFTISDDIVNHANLGQDSGFGYVKSISSALVGAGALLVIADNTVFFKNGSKEAKRAIEIAIYASAILPPILWSIFSPSAEGEERAALLLNAALPAAIGIVFTFLSY